MNYFTQELLIQLITSALCSMAFAVIFRVAPRHLLPSSLAGMFVWLIYYTVDFFNLSVFLAAFASTALATVFAELYARGRKAPAIVILSPAVIPIVPGADLYYTMKYAISADLTLAGEYLGKALAIGLGIAAGIVVVTIIMRMSFDAVAKIKQKNISTETESTKPE